MRRTSGLYFDEDLDADPAHQWDTKRKLFSMAEVYGPPSAVLVVHEKMAEIVT